MSKKSLQLINVSKRFDEVVALDCVNFALNEGEICALIGPSGSGKTTLLQIAGLLDSPTVGEVIIGAINSSKADDKTRTKIRRQNIGFIYQFHHLLPEFSALENVMMPLLIQGKEKELARNEALKTLELVDLTNRTKHKPSELSGGQQQRVAIARAIVGKPSLILADEPTGNLDSVNSRNVFDLLKNLAQELKISCLLVTHNIDLAAKLPRQAEIKDGKIL